MYFNICGSPDSIPRRTPTHPDALIKSNASSSALEQRKNEIQRKLHFSLSIARIMFLKPGRGTLNVSSTNTISDVPMELRYLSCHSTFSTFQPTCSPAIVG